MAVRKIRTMRIYGYRRDGAFKIWFDIEFEEIRYKREDNKEKEEEENQSVAIRIAKKEAEELNRKYRYEISEKMASLTVGKAIVKI